MPSLCRQSPVSQGSNITPACLTSFHSMPIISSSAAPASLTSSSEVARARVWCCVWKGGGGGKDEAIGGWLTSRGATAPAAAANAEKCRHGSLDPMLSWASAVAHRAAKGSAPLLAHRWRASAG